MIELGLNYHIKLKNLIKNSLKVKLIVLERGCISLAGHHYWDKTLRNHILRPLEPPLWRSKKLTPPLNRLFFN